MVSLSCFQLERKLLISAWTESASLLTTALVFKDSLFSTLLVVVPVLVSAPSFWSVCLLTMERNPSLDSLFTPLHKSQLLSLSLTTVFSQPILSWNTLTLLCFLTTKPFMISAGVPSTLSDLTTRTSTVLYPR